MANHANRLVMSKLSRCCYSTSSTAATVESKGKGQGQGWSLYRKLLALGGAADAAVADTVDELVKQGKIITRHDIIVCVTQLRKSNKYHHALQLYKWMENGDNKMNNADRAIHIDLLAKTEGVANAEKYFSSLEESEKTLKTYGALLSCYCKEKMTDKATELFEKMKELSFTSQLNYNNMISLYSTINQPEKVFLLEKEMEEMNVAANIYTYNQLMNTYASLKDFNAVDGVIEKMERQNVQPDLFTLENLATIYVNAGSIDKALVALRNLESTNKLFLSCEAFHTLITLYAQINNLEGVTRTWEALRSSFKKPRNKSYLVMLLALLKLEDVDGLEKCFIEWESNCSFYDVRLPNVVLESFLSRSLVNEAIAVYDRLIARGKEPNMRTLDLFTNFYLKNQNMDLALKFLEMGASKVSLERSSWFPNDETVTMFLKLIEEERDEERREKFCGIMKKIGRFDSIHKGNVDP